MSVKLTEKDKKMLSGECGEAAKLAMSIIVRMAEVFGAEELMDVSQAHIDGCGLLSDPGLEFAEKLALSGGKVLIPATLNMGPLDLQNWEKFGIDREFAAKAIRQAKAYTDLGCIPTWTCAPYQGYLTPRFGQQLVWGESNAIAYANSVLGARTERYGDYIDICGAITGRVPMYGLHLKENRKGQILLKLVGFDRQLFEDGNFFAVLGHLVGPVAGDRIPVIQGLPPSATDDQLKAFCAAVASSGSVALFHMIGITPEAPTLKAAFQGEDPETVIEIKPGDWYKAKADLFTAQKDSKLDMVVLGCPHYSFAEFQSLAAAIKKHGGAVCHPDVDFIVISSRTSYALIQPTEHMEILEQFGIRITLDTCLFHTPLMPAGTKVLMTDSGKCAYYAPGELDVVIAFGTVAECVRCAIEGKISFG